MKKILVTGSEGFLGSHLVEKLIVKGYSVKALVLYNSFNKWGLLEKLPKKILNEIEIVTGDIRDNDLMDKYIKNTSMVFHLAALIGIPYSFIAPKSYLETNTYGTLNILNAAKKYNIKVIHTSTSEVYGSPTSIPIKEDHRLFPQSPYAASKTAADQIAIAFYNSYNLPITIIRPFNTFGPRQSLRAVMPTIISQTLDKSIKFIKLGNVNTTRDFCFIDDTINGFLKTINNNKIIGETINLGTGKEFKIKNIAELIGKITKMKKKIITDPKRIRDKNREVIRLCSSNKKAQKLLNWKPKYSGLNGFEYALKLTVDWYKENNLKNKNKLYNI
jgi:dTDP-glucose 4,6-dehydratase